MGGNVLMGSNASVSTNAGAGRHRPGWLVKPEVSRWDAGQHDAADRHENSPATYKPNGANFAVKPGIGHGHPGAFFDPTAHCHTT
jgi:hypothetical protein